MRKNNKPMAIVTFVILALIEAVLLYGLAKGFDFVILLLVAIVGAFVFKEIKVIRSSNEGEDEEDDEEDWD